jgi:hypothetical protein
MDSKIDMSKDLDKSQEEGINDLLKCYTETGNEKFLHRARKLQKENKK